MERFEAEHWSCDPFDEAVVLFNDIVEIFRLNDADDPANPRELEDDVDALQTGKISAALINGDALWNSVGA